MADTLGLSFSAAFVDFDHNLYPDIIVANDKEFTANRLFKNLGNGTFLDISDTLSTGMGIDGMGTAVGDYDGDGDLDWYVTNTPPPPVPGIFGGNLLIRNDGNGNFTEVGDSAGVRVNRYGWGANFLDVDHDRDEDLFVANGNMGGSLPGKNMLLLNDGTGHFIPDSLNVLSGLPAMSFGSSIGDLNHDGFYDLGVINGDTSVVEIWQNHGTANHWIGITLEGTVSNRDAIGVWIEVWSQGQKQVRYTHAGISYGAQHSGTYLIGLGSAMQADSVVLLWPSGSENTFVDLTADQFYYWVEDTLNSHISCELIPGFTITGEELTYEFTPQVTGSPFQVYWDFGDGDTSTVQNPVHDFDAPGQYIICQTVMNGCDTATFCDTVEAYVTGIPAPAEEVSLISVFPQPFDHEITLIGLPEQS